MWMVWPVGYGEKLSGRLTELGISSSGSKKGDATLRKTISYSFVIARSRDFVIGCENALPWRLPSDLKRFRSVTWGKPIIMGRRTYQSIGRALPGRENIVVSKENGIHDPRVVVAKTKDEAKRLAEAAAQKLKTDEVMIIGGAEIFELFRDDVSRVYLTEIDTTVPSGDAFFRMDFRGWKLVAEEFVSRGEEDEFDFVVKTLDHPNRKMPRQTSANSSARPAHCFAV